MPLAQPVPVYITYLTAMPDGASIAYYDDVYGRDARQAGRTRRQRRAPVGRAARSARPTSSGT